MIAHLRGKLLYKHPGQAIVEAGGGPDCVSDGDRGYGADTPDANQRAFPRTA
jgi:hypothetical protein